MNVKQYAFVTAYLKHRDAIIAYKLATGSESTNLRSLQSAANRMLNKPGVREEIESVLKATRAEVEAEIAETTRTELMTIQRKREILAQIINGTYTVMVRAKGKNCNPCTYFNSPTISQVLTGIREDNKMAGHYAVVTTTRGKLQHIATTDLEETPNNASPRHLSRQRREGDRGTLEPDTRKLQQSATELCPPQAGESRSDGGGILAPDTREMQQSSTTEPCPSSAAEAPAKEAAKEGEMQQITTDVCPPQAGASRSDGGGILAFTPTEGRGPDTREMQQITTTSSQEKVPCLGDLGVILEPVKCEMQQITTTGVCPSSAAEAPAKEAPAAEAPAKEVAPDTREMQQITTTSSQEKVPCLGDLGVILEPVKCEIQQITTTSSQEKVPCLGDLGVILESDKPVTTPNLKKLLTETTRLANAPIPATLRPFFEAYETHSE